MILYVFNAVKVRQRTYRQCGGGILYSPYPLNVFPKVLTLRFMGTVPWDLYFFGRWARPIYSNRFLAYVGFGPLQGYLLPTHVKGKKTQPKNIKISISLQSWQLWLLSMTEIIYILQIQSALMIIPIKEQEKKKRKN